VFELVVVAVVGAALAASALVLNNLYLRQRARRVAAAALT